MRFFAVDIHTLKRYNKPNKSDDREQVDYDSSYRELPDGARQQEDLD